jgi:hypothetical protein
MNGMGNERAGQLSEPEEDVGFNKLELASRQL